MDYFRDFFDSKDVAAGVSDSIIWEQTWIGREGVGYFLGCGVMDPDAWSGTEFNILINGVKDINYGAIKDRIGSPDLMTPVEIRIPKYANIKFVVSNGSAVSTKFFGRLQCRTRI